MMIKSNFPVLARVKSKMTSPCPDEYGMSNIALVVVSKNCNLLLVPPGGVVVEPNERPSHECRRFESCWGIDDSVPSRLDKMIVCRRSIIYILFVMMMMPLEWTSCRRHEPKNKSHRFFH